MKYYNCSLNIKQELGNRAGIANSLHNIGMLYDLWGRQEDALKYYSDSLRIQQELGNQTGIADSLNNIGVIHKHQDRYEDALKYFLRALIILRALNSPNAQIADDNLSDIAGHMEAAEFERIWQAEMQEIEQKGPFVVED